MEVHVLIAEAVYDHGIIGVYSTPELAQEAAEKLWPCTDGHHGFRLEKVNLDQTKPINSLFSFCQIESFLGTNRKGLVRLLDFTQVITHPACDYCGDNGWLPTARGPHLGPEPCHNCNMGSVRRAELIRKVSDGLD